MVTLCRKVLGLAVFQIIKMGLTYHDLLQNYVSIQWQLQVYRYIDR